MDDLRKLAATQKDLEVKARLQNRIDALMDDFAVNPPPLGIELHAATFSELAGAVEKATGVPLTEPAREPQTLYSVAADTPFWELMNKNSLEIQEYGDRRVHLGLTPNGKPRPNSVIVGPAIVVPVSIEHYTKAIFNADPPQRDQRFTFDYTVILDPRIKVIKYRDPFMTKIVDNAGNILLARPNSDRQWTANQRVSLFCEQVVLYAVEKPGTKISSAEGEMDFTALVDSDRLEVADIQDKLGKPLTLNGWIVTFNRLMPSISIEVKQPPGAAKPTMPNEGLIDIQLKNGNEVLYHESTAYNCEGPAFGAGGPLTAVLSLPRRTKDVHLKFELKNLELP